MYFACNQGRAERPATRIVCGVGTLLFTAAVLALTGCPSPAPFTGQKAPVVKGGSGATEGKEPMPQAPLTVTTGQWELGFRSDGTLASASAKFPESVKGAELHALEKLQNVPSAKAASAGDAVVTLHANSWTITLDPAGRLSAVDLGPSGSDADLAALARLATIEKLTAANTRDVTNEGMKPVAKMPALRALDVEQTDVNDAGLAILASAPKLEDINLKKCDLTAEGYKHLAEIKTLKRIRAAQTNTDDACLAAIAGMAHLELLDLQDCNRITADGLAVLKNFKNLRSLRLWGETVSDQVMGYISEAKSLKSLSLDKTAVGADGLAQIQGLTGLTEMSFFGANNITSDAIEKLKPFAQLRTLDLRNTAVGNKGMVHLKGLSKLKQLDLSETGVGDKGLAELKELLSLEDLNLWLSTTTDEGLAHVGQMKSLRRLNLDKCDVGDAGLAHLRGLTDLEFLHLGNTRITDAGLENLHGMKKLQELVITFCPGVTDEGVSALQAKLPGVKITR
jgi:hypothetical protein